jgi:hypothetical protein
MAGLVISAAVFSVSFAAAVAGGFGSVLPRHRLARAGDLAVAVQS